MTLTQVEYAEQRMQQQWHDLVQAEQTGQPLETLEQMYNGYILLAEEFNALQDKYTRKTPKGAWTFHPTRRECA